MKKGFIVLIIVCVVLVAVGVGYVILHNSKNNGDGSNNEEDLTSIKITYNDETKEVKIKIGETLKYSLLGEEYEFKITDISDDKINMEVDKYGLTNTISLLSKDNKFIIEKGKSLILHTQSTDYQEKIVFEY